MATKAFQDLCRRVEDLGYRSAPNQFQLRNGSFVSSLIEFFDDNPGALEVLNDWIVDNYDQEQEEEEEE